MSTKFLAVLATTFFAIGASHAAAPSTAPAGSTGVCNDGSFYDGAQKQGACRGHKGVKDWWGASKPDVKAVAPAVVAKPAAPAPATAPAAVATTASPTPPVAPTKPTPAAAAMPSAAKKMPAQPDTLTAAPGGGAGMVWVNESSKVYHCQGDKWYGKTKQGEYMKEADAKGKGAKPAGGKACA